MKQAGAILIAGPTASGKSAAALRLAQELGGAVVNADSMQVYRDLRIITARPSPREEATAPHRLYGHVDAARRYSVGQWLNDARAIAGELREQGMLPIFTGGTGLYFRALEEGLADIPPVSGAARERVRAAAAEGPDALRRMAASLNLSAIPRDRQRLIRALEVFLTTGRELHAFHGSERPPLAEGAPIVRVFIAPERQKLRRRIEERFHAMLKEGAIEEVERLLARGLPPGLPAMKAHGVRNIASALRGETTMDEAAAGAITETRQYAKRQMTWARKFMSGWLWVDDWAEAAQRAASLAPPR